MNERVWEAMQSGQEIPRGMSEREAWRMLGDAACRTAVDVVRESCLNRLLNESGTLLLKRVAINQRLRVLDEAIAAVRNEAHDWKEKCRRASE